jgi:uncharacterized membrane protein YdjX (TVP38/TMEM64 family)
MTPRVKLSRLALAGVLGCGLLAPGLLAPAPAEAGSKGRRNTALVLGGAAVYGAVTGKPEVAIGAGAGAAYSYVRSRDARRAERRWEEDRFRYGRGGRYDDRYRYDDRRDRRRR